MIQIQARNLVTKPRKSRTQFAVKNANSATTTPSGAPDRKKPPNFPEDLQTSLLLSQI
jgi:hypothetical protein